MCRASSKENTKRYYPIAIEHSPNNNCIYIVVPRRLTNPRCSSKWWTESQGSNTLIEYEDLGKINFYRLSPQYFYHEGRMRYLKIKPISSVAIVVCSSRTISSPYRNPSSAFTEGQDCKQLASSEFSYDLTYMCKDFNQLMDCPPLYLSVQVQGFAEIAQVLCTNEACPTPTTVQYSIMVNNLDCTSDAISNFRGLSMELILSMSLISWNVFIPHTRRVL